MALIIQKYNPDFFHVWNDFIASSRSGVFLFHRDFMEYHADRFEDYSLLVFNDNKLISVLPANCKDGIVYSHQGLTFGGFMFKKDVKYNVIKDVVEAVLQYLKEASFSSIIIKQMPSFYCSEQNDELLYIQHQFNAVLNASFTSIVTKKLDLKYSRVFTRNVTKALNNKIEIVESDDFDSFWNSLLIPRLSKKHNSSPVHTLQEIKLLRSKFPDKIKLYAAFYNDVMVAGLVVFRCKHVDKLQYLAGHDDYDELGGIQLLHKVVFESKEKPFVDCGGSIEPSTKEVNPSLLLFKEFFSAKMHAVYTLDFQL